MTAWRSMSWREWTSASSRAASAESPPSASTNSAAKRLHSSESSSLIAQARSRRAFQTSRLVGPRRPVVLRHVSTLSDASGNDAAHQSPLFTITHKTEMASSCKLRPSAIAAGPSGSPPSATMSSSARAAAALCSQIGAAHARSRRSCHASLLVGPSRPVTVRHHWPAVLPSISGGGPDCRSIPLNQSSNVAVAPVPAGLELGADSCADAGAGEFVDRTSSCGDPSPDDEPHAPATNPHTRTTPTNDGSLKNRARMLSRQCRVQRSTGCAGR